VIYRQHARGTCTLCNALTDSGCPRCGRPLCERHRPPPELRCSECEAEFAEVVRAFQSERERLVPEIPGRPSGPGLLDLLTEAAHRLTLWRLRRRFLRERLPSAAP